MVDDETEMKICVIIVKDSFVIENLFSDIVLGSIYESGNRDIIHFTIFS